MAERRAVEAAGRDRTAGIGRVSPVAIDPPIGSGIHERILSSSRQTAAADRGRSAGSFAIIAATRSDSSCGTSGFLLVSGGGEWLASAISTAIVELPSKASSPVSIE